ncbi:MAG TPA: TetR/AcrR family transcriptional regulator [Polyangiaceae bacterium]|nr:TetR/AcrR family transcriptional regulator [Polyangiaceae bacterium]
MPYAADHKLKTRARIVDSARVLFNRHGFDAVSIDDVMKNAGLTRGGFYHHFTSKASLYAAAVSSFTSCNPFAERLEQNPKRRSARELAALLVDTYLSDETLADVDKHCPLIALPSDVARAGLQPRAAYTQLVESMLEVFRAAFPKGDRQGNRKAQLIVNLCVGGMLIARTTDEPTLRKQLRSAARSEALRLLATSE